jgi:TgpA N-terminal domain/Transglutaminase-like superfamily
MPAVGFSIAKIMSKIWFFILTVGLVCFLCLVAGFSISQSAIVILVFAILIGLFLWLAYEKPIPRAGRIYLDPTNAPSRAPSSALGNPVITPVAESELPKKLAAPIPQRLPTVSIPSPPSEPREIQPEVLPNFTVAPSSIEESLLFRVLVQGLFTIGSVSADLAVGTHYSQVAIPITAAGAAWSWYRRHHSKHWLNTIVSVASIAFLIGALVPTLLKEVQIGIDGAATSVKFQAAIALGLQMLLVDLQIGLSFHLYGRKVLGYCVAISGLLMAIAAYLSQSLGFIILLGAFVALVIPTLMLDYRSRLALKPVGISPIPTKQLLPYRHLPWKYLSQLAAIALGIGLMLAVFLPNFHFPHLSLQLPGQMDEITALQNRMHDLAQQSQRGSPPTSPSPTAQQLSVGEMASKLLGQPGNNNYPDLIKQDNLQLPPEIASKLQQFTNQILATAPQPLNSDYDRAAYLADYLKQHHQVDPQQSDPANLPSVDAKSIQQIITKCPPERQNCPIVVATDRDLPVVYTSMLRSIGIPARLKTGDKPSELDPKTQMYARPPAASQSQTEVYFPNWGWFGLDSTPDRPLLNPDARQLAQLQQQVQTKPLSFADPASSPQPTPNIQPTPSPSPGGNNYPGQSSPSVPSPNTPSPTFPFPNTSSLFTPNSNNAPSNPTPSKPPFELPKWEPDLLILKIIVVAICIGIGIAWYLSKQKQQQQQLAGLPPVERIYRSMLTELSKQGSFKRPTQTQLEYADSTSKIYHPQIAKVVREISQSYTAWRYGKQKTDVKELTKKLQFLQHLQQLAAQRARQQQIDRFKSQLGFKTHPLK